MIIANMVIKDEADNYLSQVLERLETQVDLICITDDCSSDNSVEIASAFEKVRIHSVPEPMFATSEGRFRQASWEWLEQHVSQPDDTLILAIDADEELYASDLDLAQYLGFINYDVFGIAFCHMWNETQFRVDGGWKPNISTRLFRYKPGGSFLDRALACGSEPTYVLEAFRQRRFFPNTGLVMKHLSYIKDEDKQKKYDRYMNLDKGDFHALAHIQSIIDPPEKVTLVDWEFEN